MNVDDYNIAKMRTLSCSEVPFGEDIAFQLSLLWALSALKKKSPQFWGIGMSRIPHKPSTKLSFDQPLQCLLSSWNLLWVCWVRKYSIPKSINVLVLWYPVLFWYIILVYLIPVLDCIHNIYITLQLLNINSILVIIDVANTIQCILWTISNSFEQRQAL